MDLATLIIQKTMRVPAVSGPAGDGSAVARQMDAVLVGAGFKASKELMEHISGLDAGVAMDTAVRVVGAVRELVGDHVKHNVYFRDFPFGVPDTMEFWVTQLRAVVESRVDALGGVLTLQDLRLALSVGGVNLLDLPTYGRYQHSHEEMLAAHDELIPALTDRVTVVHLGASLEQETRALYLALAGSTIPLSDADLALLCSVAMRCVEGEQPATIPIRENRAVINRIRLAAGKPLLVDTVTDVLRLACVCSDGDVSLDEPTRFQSFRQKERRLLMAALNDVVAANSAKLGDVNRYREQWKRLGERLHPHEYPHLPHAQDVFAVARERIKPALSLAARVECAFDRGDRARAVNLMESAPGLLFRSLDRVLRTGTASEVDLTLKAAGKVIGQVSGRVILSLREHVDNRTSPDEARIFVNRKGRAWVTPDGRAWLDPSVTEQLAAILDEEVARRVPAHDRLVVDPAVRDLAVPLSDKTKSDGFGVMPRGSVVPIEGDLLRFFTYWKQTSERTDFDLSALLLDEDFESLGHVSWTNYHRDGAYYSGDITDARNGASEFIDIPLRRVSARYIVPQVNIYSGEGFDEVAESMFGFMTRGLDQRGQPFEPSTVRMRSTMRGPSRVALPMVFMRGGDGSWTGKWLHLYTRGSGWGNRVEANRMSTALLARNVVKRQYLPVSHLVDAMAAKAGSVATYSPGMRLDGPVTFIGIHRPEGLPAGSKVYGLDRLGELVPA